jgi:hypothetical protein
MDRASAVIYCAGFFDGEGCISLESVGAEWRLRCITTQKFVDAPLHLLVDTFGGKVHWFKSDQRSGHIINGKKAVAMLEEMLPYLTVKADQALIAMGFFSMGPEQRASAHTQMRSLKKEYKFLGASS